MKFRDKIKSTLKLKPTKKYKKELKLLKRQVKWAIRNDSKCNLLNEIKKHNLFKGIQRVHNIKKPSSCNFDMDPNMVNDFFVNISMPSTTTQSNKDVRHDYNDLDITKQTFQIHSVTPQYLYKLWKKMKNQDSASYDHLGICPKMIPASLIYLMRLLIMVKYRTY
ncbi:unnamed protein product [Orchesella dallaii]|uniref:Uncharacterized protein n=1 Tax=Orchesella dallaii TaxID=48710 RepID=A0ABP1QBX5_9HEXA